MPPRDFSEDGAAGAGGGTPGSQTGSQTGSHSVSDSGMGGGSGTLHGLDAVNAYTRATIDPGGGGSFSNGPGGPSWTPTSQEHEAGYNAYESGLMNGTPGTYKSQGGVYSVSPAGGGSSGFGGNFTGAGNGSPVGLAFSRGGAIPDDNDTNGSPQQDQISRALDTVDQVLAFGRKQHGLGGGDNEGIPQQQAMNTDGFRQSDNMEDRRDETSPGPSPSRTKFDDLSDKISGAVSNITASYNPMSQQAGINDIGSQQQPASGQAAGAIDTSDEENQ